jgi:hypothetical protein
MTKMEAIAVQVHNRALKAEGSSVNDYLQACRLFGAAAAEGENDRLYLEPEEAVARDFIRRMLEDEAKPSPAVSLAGDADKGAEATDEGIDRQ